MLMVLQAAANFLQHFHFILLQHLLLHLQIALNALV